LAKIDELKNFSGSVQRKSRRKRKNEEQKHVRHTITVPPLLDKAIEELRGEKSYSTFVCERLMKVIDIEVKV